MLISLEFCKSIEFLLTELNSEVEIGLMDDISLSADLDTLERDITKIIEVQATTGLKLNTSKCEIIMDDFSLIVARSISRTSSMYRMKT